MGNLVIDPNSLTPEQLSQLMKAGAIKNTPAFNIEGKGTDLPPITSNSLNKVRNILSDVKQRVVGNHESTEDPILTTLAEILEQRKAEYESGLTTKAELDLAEKAYSLAFAERFGSPKKKAPKIEKKLRKKVVDTKLHCRSCGKKRYGSFSTIYLNIDGEVHLQYLNLKAVMSSLLNDEDFLPAEYYISNCYTCKENTYFRISKFKNYRKLIEADETVSKKIAAQLEKMMLAKQQKEDSKVIIP